MSTGSVRDRVKRVLPGSVKSGLALGLRAYGSATARLRPFPDFLIIGAKRGGTTSLFNYLVQHPGVAAPFPASINTKGVRFFDRNFSKGPNWYRSHFPTELWRRGPSGRRLTGEATPYYLFHPHTARRAHDLLPAAKIVVLLRDPVERAYSHHRERARRGVETLSFEEALVREPERLRGELERMLEDESYCSFAHEHFSYVAQGAYAEPLRVWTTRYPPERVLLLRSEDLFGDPRSTYLATLEFLGLAPWEPGAYARYGYRPPESEMAPETRRMLEERLTPEVKALESMLGRSMGWSIGSGREVSSPDVSPDTPSNG